MSTIIGFGTFPMKDILKTMIPLAKKNGYTFVDTSDDYYNERIVAQAAKETGIKIFTKYSYIERFQLFEEHFQKQSSVFEEYNLKISCYLLHWPYPFIYKKIWKKMEQLYFDGIVDEIGVCNFNVRHLEELMKNCRVKPMYNQIELHPLFQQKDIVQYCNANNIKIICYSPFARMDKELLNNCELNEIAKKKNNTIHNIILKWCMQKGYIPIPSTSNSNHLNSMSVNNLMNIELTKDEMDVIDSLDNGKRVRFDPETYFSLKTKVKLFLLSLFMR